MLDTIILELPINPANITDFKQFRTTQEIMQNCQSGYSKWVNNPTKEDWETGVYKPRLTIIKRGFIF